MNAPGALVLLVEDEPPMRRFLRASLTSNGFRLVEASSAREAVALATSHNPEIVLLDLGLPDGDGIELTRQLREWSHVPILVISARGRVAVSTAVTCRTPGSLRSVFSHSFRSFSAALWGRGAVGSSTSRTVSPSTSNACT